MADDNDTQMAVDGVSYLNSARLKDLLNRVTKLEERRQAEEERSQKAESEMQVLISKLRHTKSDLIIDFFLLQEK